MIKKTLIIFLILFGAHTVIVSYIANPDRYISEHQWQDNQIKTQKYLFTDLDSVDAIIVGSSLSERIHMNMLPHFYNLGLLGLGPIDGMSVVKAKGKYPQYVFVEINHIDRQISDELKNSIENPLMTPLRHHLISLRDGKQPMGFIAIPYGQKATAYGVYLMQTALTSISPKHQLADTTNTSVDMVDKMLAQSIEYQNKIPDNLDIQIGLLKEYVDIMSQNGSTVIFFEMPIQPQLCGLPRSVAIRNKVYKAFPENEYKYINVPECGDYTTTDGEHLDFSSAQKYTEYLVNQIKSLNINP